MVKAKKLFQWALILIAVIVGLLVIRPFIAALAFAAVLAYLLYPAHDWLQKKIKKWPSATLLTIFVVVIILSFIAWGINFLLTEFSQAYIQISKANFEQIFPQEMFGETVSDVVKLVFSKFITYLSDSISKIPRILLSFFVFVLAFFYFLKDGKKLWKWFAKHMPLQAPEKKSVINELERYAHAFVYVWLLIAVLQGIVAAVGFYLFGLQYWAIAGLAAAVLSVIPVLGPYLIYLPTGIVMIASGQIPQGIGLITYGLVIGSILDYVVRPYYTSKWAAIHPLIIFIGIFGGMLLLGPAGIIIGPLLLLMAAAILRGTGPYFVKNK